MRSHVEVVSSTVLNIVVAVKITDAWKAGQVDATAAMTGLLLLAGVDVIGRWRAGKEPPPSAGLLVLAGVFASAAGEVSHAITALLHTLTRFV